jgi:hypothetical protein
MGEKVDKAYSNFRDEDIVEEGVPRRDNNNVD